MLEYFLSPQQTTEPSFFTAQESLSEIVAVVPTPNPTGWTGVYLFRTVPSPVWPLYTTLGSFASKCGVLLSFWPQDYSFIKAMSKTLSSILLVRTEGFGHAYPPEADCATPTRHRRACVFQVPRRLAMMLRSNISQMFLRIIGAH